MRSRAAGQQMQLDTFAAAAGGGRRVAGYRIYRNGTAVATTAATTYTDTGLQPITTYTYTVTALRRGGQRVGAVGPGARRRR